jgi:hypothetical protein
MYKNGIISPYLRHLCLPPTLAEQDEKDFYERLYFGGTPSSSHPIIISLLQTLHCEQGDQIGRILVHWVIVYSLHFFIPRLTLCNDFDHKMRRAEFWATLSRTSGHPDCE